MAASVIREPAFILLEASFGIKGERKSWFVVVRDIDQSIAFLRGLLREVDYFVKGMRVRAYRVHMITTKYASFCASEFIDLTPFFFLREETSSTVKLVFNFTEKDNIYYCFLHKEELAIALEKFAPFREWDPTLPHFICFSASIVSIDADPKKTILVTIGAKWSLFSAKYSI